MSLAARVEALEERVAALEGERPGRKVLPTVATDDHVCGVDPERDSTTCPDGSLYRRRKGCRGDACVQAANEYYEQYREQRAEAERAAVAVALKRRRR